MLEFNYKYKKNEKQKRTRENILSNRIEYIKKKLRNINESDIKDLNFYSLKKDAIKGLNRYVIANDKSPSEDTKRL